MIVEFGADYYRKSSFKKNEKRLLNLIIQLYRRDIRHCNDIKFN